MQIRDGHQYEPRSRPWVVSVDLDRDRTFGTRVAAFGYALDEIVHRMPGSRAIVRHRRTGPYLALERRPGRQVAMRVNWTGDEWD